MALDAVGSTIYVNQQMASVSSEHTARLNRIEMQNVTAAIAVNTEEKEVIEVRPAEENHSVNEDREHERQEHDEEQKKSSKKNHEDEKKDDSSLYHLDIKV